jgi:drug/metabolite transporter (DMT)-like permease
MPFRYRQLLLLHVIVFLWGFTGILGKIIQLDALVLVWYRLLIAFVAIALYLGYRGQRIALHWKTIIRPIGVGFLVALHWITFYYAIQWSTASLGILCLATTTLHVVWLEKWIMGYPWEGKKIVLGFVVLIGVALATKGVAGNTLPALLIGLLSAFFAASFSVSNAYLVKHHPAAVLSFIELVAGWVLVSLYFLFFPHASYSFSISWIDAFGLLFLGIVCTAFAFIAAVKVVNHLGAFTVSLTINLEPIYTMVFAIFLLEEHKTLGIGFYLCTALIVGVLFLNAYLTQGKTLKKIE